VVGFHEERDKVRVLRADTRKSCFRDVDIVPDLTKTQRQEEDAMRGEMISRNKRASSEDRAKNLAWVVVGPRGARRLIKKRIDMEEEMAAGRRSQGVTAAREQHRQPGVTAESRLRHMQTVTAVHQQPTVTAAEVEMGLDLECLEQTQEPPEMAARGQLGSKRGRGGSTDAEEPPQARLRQ
jgi:hypothetical protein